ncbi:MAG: sensor histidine kinase [Pyrinomonadaceae bacterium]
MVKPPSMASSVPDRGRAAKWLLIFGVWTLFALFFASQFALQNQLSENPIPFWRILSWQLVSGYAWFVFSPIILTLSAKYPFEDQKWKVSVPIHVVASILVSLCLLAVDAFILPKLGYLARFQLTSFFETYKILFFVNFHFSIAIYWAVVAIHQAILYYRKYRERELKTSQLEARLAQSRLQVLKMQLHPHFLFNTLNAISELIHRNPDVADRMITDLSDLLRMSFENLEVQEIPLSQELEFLRKYLEIEQTRFHDRLEVKMEIAADTLDASVPNMILQPLVENAIKHGISPKADGGHINVTAARSNGHLQISVSDDGVGVPGGEVSRVEEGVGLSNTRRRLRHLYGDAHTFELNSVGGHGVNVDLDIPYRQYENVPRSNED